MKTHFRSATVALLLGAAVIAASGASAKASFSTTIVTDDSSQATTVIVPSTQIITNSIGPLYTANGLPTQTNVGGNVTLNFNADLSAAFGSVADGAIVIQQSTDGHLVLDVHFDNPTSISAIINEGGIYGTTGNGSVAVNGGEVVIEAVDPVPVETHSSALTASFDGQGGWTASASTLPFTGLYTDYQIAVDNDLVATATDGSASIFKKDFTITLTPGGGNPPTPEPASLSLLGLGAAALVFRRRRA